MNSAIPISGSVREFRPVYDPARVQAEQDLLGLLFNADHEAIGSFFASGGDKLFADPLHQRVLHSLHSLFDAGNATTAAAITNVMGDDPGLLELEGEREYLLALAQRARPDGAIVHAERIAAHLAPLRFLVESKLLAQDVDDLAPALARGDADAVRALAELGHRANEIAIKPKLAPPLLTGIRASVFEGREIPLREEFVEGMIPHGSVTLLYGDGATGKSLLALQLGVATVTRTNFLGRIVYPNGPVLMVTAEDVENELHRRLGSILASTGGSFEQLRDFHLFPRVGEDNLLAVLTDHRTLAPTALFAALEKKVREIEPVLLIIDNAADAFGGNEIDRTQVRQFIGMLSGIAVRRNLTVLLLAHPSESGMSSGSGTSGSTAWSNSARSRLYFKRIKNKQGDEDDTDARILTVKKYNYGVTGSEVRMRWERGVFVEVNRTAADAIALKNRASEMFLSLLKEFSLQKRYVGESPGKSYAPAIFAGHERSKVAGIDSDEFKRAMERLFTEHKIEIQEDGPPSRRSRKIVIIDGAAA